MFNFNKRKNKNNVTTAKARTLSEAVEEGAERLEASVLTKHSSNVL